jgi:hypothetical protein
MSPLREEIMLDLFSRMADLIDAGMEPDAALMRAAEDMKAALRATVARIAADAFREANTTVH